MVKTKPIYGGSRDSLLLLFYPHLSYFSPYSCPDSLPRRLTPKVGIATKLPSVFWVAGSPLHWLFWISVFTGKSLVVVGLLSWNRKTAWIEPLPFFRTFSQVVLLQTRWTSGRLPPTAPPELQGEAGPCGPEGLGGGAQEQWRLQQGEGLSRCCLRGSLGTEDQVELSADLSAETGDGMVGWWPPGMAWWNFGCNMWRKKTLFMILCAYLFGW